MKALPPPQTDMKKFLRSFTYAFSGVLYCVKNERNFRFHLCAAVTVTAFMKICGLSPAECCVIYLCIGGVLGFELMNTAVERAADMQGEEISPLAKAAKDCAAGAVLAMAVCSALCGFVLFFQKDRLSVLAGYFLERPAAAAGLIIWIAAAFCFVFRRDKGK